MQPAHTVQLVFSLEGDRVGDAEQLDLETRRLREAMTELDVESVELAAAGDVPAGAKSGEAAAIGTLVVTALPVVLPKVFEVLQSWMQRRQERTVKIHATAGDRTFDIEYAPRTVSQSDLGELMASISRALNPPSGSGA